MLREVDTDNPALTEDDIREFENRVNVDLPRSYVRFLMQHNGGYPIPNEFPIEGLPNNPRGAIQVFLGLRDTEASTDLENVVRELSKTVPKGILPIACTGCGDLICLDLRKQSGPVVFWDMHEFWGNEVWHENLLYPVAPNFEAFLEYLGGDVQ